MSEDMRLYRVASGLSRGQRSTIMALGEKPSSLGCSAVIADRMAKARSTRPALVTKTSGMGEIQYSLNADGEQVKAILGDRTPK